MTSEWVNLLLGFNQWIIIKKNYLYAFVFILRYAEHLLQGIPYSTIGPGGTFTPLFNWDIKTESWLNFEVRDIHPLSIPSVSFWLLNISTLTVVDILAGSSHLRRVPDSLAFTNLLLTRVDGQAVEGHPSSPLKEEGITWSQLYAFILLGIQMSVVAGWKAHPWPGKHLVYPPKPWTGTCYSHPP